MRPLHLYLGGYFLLVIGAGLALWQAGVLARIGFPWVAVAVLITFGLGVLLALISRRTVP